MRGFPYRRACAHIVAVAVVAAGFGRAGLIEPAAASTSRGVRPLTLTLTGPNRPPMRAPATYTGRLSVGGTGVPSAAVDVLVDGVRAAQTETYLDGRYTVDLAFDVPRPRSVRAVAYADSPIATESDALRVTPAVRMRTRQGPVPGTASLASGDVGTAAIIEPVPEPGPDNDTSKTGGATLVLQPHSSELAVNGLDYVEHTTTAGWKCSYDSACKVAGLDFALDVWSGGVVTESHWNHLGVELPAGTFLGVPVIPVLDTQGVVPMLGIVWVFPILVGGGGGGGSSSAGPASQLAALEGVASGETTAAEYAEATLPHYLDMVRDQPGFHDFAAWLRDWVQWARSTNEGDALLDELRASLEAESLPPELIDVLDDPAALADDKLAETFLSGLMSGFLSGPAYGGLRESLASLHERGSFENLWNPVSFMRAMETYRDAMSSGNLVDLQRIQASLQGVIDPDGFPDGAPTPGPSPLGPTPADFERALGEIARQAPGEGAAAPNGVSVASNGEEPVEPLQLGLGMLCIFCGGLFFEGGPLGLGLSWQYRSIAFPGPPPHLDAAYSESAEATRTVAALQLPFPGVVSLVASFVVLLAAFVPLPVAIPADVAAFLVVYSALALFLQYELGDSGPSGFQEHCGGRNPIGFLGIPILSTECFAASVISIPIELDPVALPMLFFGMKDPLATVAATGKELRIRFVVVNVGFEAGRADLFETIERDVPESWGPIPYTGARHTIESFFFDPANGYVIEEYRTESPVVDEAALFVLHTHLDSYDIDERGPAFPADTSYNNEHELLHDMPIWDAFTFVIAKPLDLIVWTEPSGNDAIEQAKREVRANKGLNENVPKDLNGCLGEGFAEIEALLRTPCGADADAHVDTASGAAAAGFTELASSVVGVRDTVYALSDGLLGPGQTRELVENNLFFQTDLGEEVIQGGETGANLAGSADGVWDEANLPASYDGLSPTQQRVREIFGDRKDPNGQVGFRIHEVYDAEMLVNLEFSLLENAADGLDAVADELAATPLAELTSGDLDLSPSTLALLGESLLGSTVLVMAPAPGAGATVIRDDPVNPIVPADFLLNLLHASGIQGFVADGSGADWLAFRHPIAGFEFIPYGGMFVGAETSEHLVDQIGAGVLNPVATVTFEEFHDLVLPAGNVTAVPTAVGTGPFVSLGSFLRDNNGVLTSPDDTHPSSLHQIADLAATAALGLRYTARNSGNDTDLATNLGWLETAMLLETLIGLGPKALEAGEVANDLTDDESGDEIGAVLGFAADETNTRVVKRPAGSSAVGATCLEFRPVPVDAGIGVPIPFVLDARAVIIGPPLAALRGEWDRVVLEVVQDSGSAIATGIVDPLYSAIIAPFLAEFVGALPEGPSVPPLATGIFDPFLCS